MKFRTKNTDEEALSSDDTDSPIWDKKKLIEQNHKDLASPSVWIPLSLFVAFMFAVENEMKSWISKYKNDAMLLQSPGCLMTSLLLFTFYCYQSEYGKTKKKDDTRTDRSNKTQGFGDTVFGNLHLYNI